MRTVGLDDFHAAREPQAKADVIYRLFDSQAPQPRVLQGESPLGYRQRVASELKRHSPAWRDVEVRTLPTAAFEVAERQIYADAEREARAPTNVPAGQLIERVERCDKTGRCISRFFGDPEVTWGPFKLATRSVTGMCR
jgi:hypothetical protein